MTAKAAGAHAFTRERQIFPLRGRWLHPPGLPLTGPAPLRCAKDKSIAHYVRSHKGVCNECVLACARTKDKNTKDKALHKGVLYVACTPCTAPSGASAIGAHAAQGTQTTSALHKGVFYDRACSLRSHKSVRSASSALALAQRRVLWKYVLLILSVCTKLTSAITGRVHDIDERHTKA